MPTNDERREVAARLRLSSPTYDHGDNPDWSSSLCAIVQASPNEIFNRLADLIEPDEKFYVAPVININIPAMKQDDVYQALLKVLRRMEEPDGLSS